MGTAASEGIAPRDLAISVVICAFTMDRWDALRDAIGSLRRQTMAPSEIVLVIDHAPALEAASRAAWPDVNVVANRETQGLSGARNTGIAEATGDVVAFLDDDALARPDWLERLAAAYADERVIGAGGHVEPRWVEGRPRWFPAEFDWVVGCSHSGMPRSAERVRNLIGANMSFRRDVLLGADGFRHELGRVGSIPAGCEETELCIRLGQLRPGDVILYDPAAVVDHVVPGRRARLRYFVSRCAAEGRSKAILAGLVGSDAGLEAERSYVRRTLPMGVARGLGEALRGRPAGAARAAMLAIGLLTTARGYVDGRRAVRRAAPAPATVADADEPLRVLMVTPRSPLGHGGVERHVMEVSRRLVRDGVRVQVLCGEPGGPPVHDDAREGVNVRSVRAWPADRDYILAPRIWREMAREQWDVIHIQSYHTLITPLAMARALTLGIPYVVTFHGGGHSSVVRHSLRGVQRRAMRGLLARASRLVAVARFEIDDYGRELRLAPEHFALIPNGSDLEAAPESTEDHSQGGLLASIGRLERYKGHHRVIGALPYVLEQRPDAHLLIVGTGPYEDALRRLVSQLGLGASVEFTHVAPADRVGMARLLDQIALVVLLSDFETQPLVALEAAAARRPLLVADRAGLGELVRNGVARAVALNDPPAMVARAIVEELERPQPAKPPMLTSWDECTAALLELYRAVR